MNRNYLLTTAGITTLLISWLWAFVLDAETGTPTAYLLGAAASVGFLLLVTAAVFAWRDSYR